MDGSRFDRIARRLAGRSSRRGVIRSAAAGTAVGVGGAVVGHAPARAQGTPDAADEELAVSLYEQLAALADAATGDCADLAKQSAQFSAEHADDLQRIMDTQVAWDQATREAHVDRYGSRLDAATKTLHFALERCGHRGDGSVASPTCGAGAATPTASAAVQFVFAAAQADDSSCDCTKECPIGSGACVGYWFACVAGDHCSCCNSSLCGSTSHCLNDCTSNECCATPCGQPWVPPPPPTA